MNDPLRSVVIRPLMVCPREKRRRKRRRKKKKINEAKTEDEK